MPNFNLINNGESGLSVRTTLNEVIDFINTGITTGSSYTYITEVTTPGNEILDINVSDGTDNSYVSTTPSSVYSQYSNGLQTSYSQVSNNQIQLDTTDISTTEHNQFTINSQFTRNDLNLGSNYNSNFILDPQGFTISNGNYLQFEDIDDLLFSQIKQDGTGMLFTSTDGNSNCITEMALYPNSTNYISNSNGTDTTQVDFTQSQFFIDSSFTAKGFPNNVLLHLEPGGVNKVDITSYNGNNTDTSSFYQRDSSNTLFSSDGILNSTSLDTYSDGFSFTNTFDAKGFTLDRGIYANSMQNGIEITSQYNSLEIGNISVNTDNLQFNVDNNIDRTGRISMNYLGLEETFGDYYYTSTGYSYNMINENCQLYSTKIGSNQVDLGIDPDFVNSGNKFEQSLGGGDLINGLYLDANQVVGNTRFQAIDNMNGFMSQLVMTADNPTFECGDGVNYNAVTLSLGGVIISATDGVDTNTIEMTPYITNFSSVPSFDDDTDAGSGGLQPGDLYQTTGFGSSPLNVAGILMIKQ